MTERQSSARRQKQGRFGSKPLLDLLPLLAVLVATGPLLIWGFPAGHDWGWELVRLVEYREALTTGQLPPYWAADLYGGWGSPIFLFYAPLFSAMASIASIVFGSLLAGPTVVLIVLTMMAAFLVGRMMSELPQESGSCRAAASRVAVYVYVLSPYLLADLLIRNANAEYTALCLLPLMVYGVLRLRNRPLAGALALALGLGLAILAHNLTALVALALAVLLAAVLYLPTRSVRQVAFGGAGVGLGLLLAAWFWVPAVALTDLVRPELLVEGRYDFHQNFLTVSELWGFGEFYSAGLCGPLIVIMAAVVAFSSRLKLSHETRRIYWLLLGCALLAMILQTVLSRPLWDVTPLLPLFQFPWRLNGPLALLSAALAGLLFLGLAADLKRRTVILLELVVLALCVLNAVPQLTRVGVFTDQARASIEGGLTPEAIRQGRQSATGVDEYLPAAADLAAWKETTPGDLLVTPPAGLTVLSAEESGVRVRLELEADEQSRLRLARWYFPDWRGALNGEPIAVASGPVGEVVVEVPRGRSDLEVVLVPPLVRRVAIWISFLAVLLFVLALGVHLLPWLGSPPS